MILVAPKNRIVVMRKLLLLAVVATVSCASTPPPPPPLRVTEDPAVVKDCQFLQAVQFEAIVGGEERAKEQLIQEAFGLGADTLLLRGVYTPPWPRDHPTARGDAYRCEHPKA
jgi:hypothetical protein